MAYMSRRLGDVGTAVNTLRSPHDIWVPPWSHILDVLEVENRVYLIHDI